MNTTTDDPGVLGTAFAGLSSSKEAAALLAETAVEGARSTREALRRQLETSPWTTLGAVAGVGFVVAGGLASPAVWGIARVAFAGVAKHLGSVVLEAQAASTAATAATAAAATTSSPPAPAPAPASTTTPSSTPSSTPAASAGGASATP